MKNRILIVDDEEGICSVLQDYLDEIGYETVVAKTLAEARQVLAETTLPNVVILDVMLPDGNGMQYLSELRNGRRTRAVPVILISAHARQLQDKINGFGYGADEYLVKPFDLRELRARIESLIRRVSYMRQVFLDEQAS